MNTTRTLTFLAAILAAAMLTGCQSLLRDGSTHLRIKTDSIEVVYASPKDQHLEYDPETGKVTVKSSTNQALAESAAAVQAEANRAIAETLGKVVDRVPVLP